MERVVTVTDVGSGGDGAFSYTGRLVDSKRDGRGLVKSRSPHDGTTTTYDGEWRGLMHGRGVLSWSSSSSTSTYDGEWQQGQRDGWGACSTPAGGVHGEWAWNEAAGAHEMQGWGVQRVRAPGGGGPMATVYEGEWDRNKWHGTGMWRSPETGDIYYGNFDRGVRSGRGALFEAAGGNYGGEWKDGLFHGRGARMWGDGTMYFGKWERGKEHGSGTKTWACDGTVITGVWEAGVLKSGTKRWPNGDEFTGKFSADRVGDGTAKFRDWQGREVTCRVVKLQQNGVFQELRGGPFHHLGRGGVDPQITTNLQQRIDLLENENSQLKCSVQQLLREKAALQGQLRISEEYLQTAKQNLSDQTELMRGQEAEFQKQGECIDHVLQHIQQGCWVKSLSSTPQKTDTCKRKEVSVTLERTNNTFLATLCSQCPLDKIVKMEIERKFSIDENIQAVSFVGDNCSERSLSNTSLTLGDLSSTAPAQLQVRVRVPPVTIIREADLRFLSRLESGSYGAVYKYIYVPASQEVAVKTLHESIASDYNNNHFRLEAEIVSGLRHPNIVKCIGTCTPSPGQLLIVSELMCCSLRQILQQKPLTFIEVVGPCYMQKYMHRDLSSNNVLLAENGTPKICDFGMSRGMTSQNQTKVPGTPIYMAPQMFTKNYSIKGDQWSFGILIAEMIHPQITDLTFQSLPLLSQANFLAEQKALLQRSDAEEVTRLCGEVPEYTVADCLNRRNACIKVVKTMTHPHGSPQLYAIPEDLLSLVVQSCISILEKNRIPFTLVVHLLLCCCSTTVHSLSISGDSGADGDDYEQQVQESIIRQWLASLSPSIHLVAPSSTSPIIPPPKRL
ncbi:phosphatidylinositol 4-phosphate 5-kinase 8 [Pelomyxa schiedti]|nr:phosphatidylinositol 4-phosphate 5-kinase 8 [Pelomyxa schiedti]